MIPGTEEACRAEGLAWLGTQQRSYCCAHVVLCGINMVKVKLCWRGVMILPELLRQFPSVRGALLSMHAVRMSCCGLGKACPTEELEDIVRGIDLPLLQYLA